VPGASVFLLCGPLSGARRLCEQFVHYQNETARFVIEASLGIAVVAYRLRRTGR
jgi:hypothetical protein